MEAFDQFLTSALTSDFFAGGLALGAFGVAAAFLRIAFMALYRVIVRRVWVSLTLDNRSAAYRHFCIWMEQNNVLSHLRHVRMTDGSWARGTKGYALHRASIGFSGEEGSVVWGVTSMKSQKWAHRTTSDPWRY